MPSISISRVFRAAWSQVVLALLIGTLLTFVPERHLYSPLHDVGIGLIVAAFVTLFWHLREFSEFFERLSTDVLLKDEYLERLNVRSLTKLRSKAARQILESCSDNSHYQRLALGDWIDTLMFDHLLPGKSPLSGMYREAYEEKIQVEFITLEKALRDVGAPVTDVPAAALADQVVKVTETVWYTIVPPSRSDRTYPVSYSGESADMPYFPFDKRVRVFVGEREDDAKELLLKFSREPHRGISYVALPRELPFRDGKCKVWLRNVDYRSRYAESHILNTMSVVTRNLKIDLFQVGSGPKLAFAGDVMAPGEDKEIHHYENGVALEFTGWLFEDHG